MFTTGSADEVGHAWEPAAAVQSLQVTPHEPQAMLDGLLDERLGGTVTPPPGVGRQHLRGISILPPDSRYR